MIVYEEGYWSLAFALRVKGSVLPRALAWSIPCAVLTFILHRMLKEQEAVAQTLSDASSASVLQGFTFVLGFLIVFRTQQAYSRWWEGGTLLQQLRGEWFNAFSNLMAFGNADVEFKEDVIELNHQMVRLFSLLYGSALVQVSQADVNIFEFIEFDRFDRAAMAHLNEVPDACEVVLQWIQRLIVEANTNNLIKIAPPILARVYNQLGQGIVKLNNARKIKHYPIPFSLAQLIVGMLLFHWVATAVITASMVESSWMASMISFAVIFSFWGVNYIAVELEGPFGNDWNDLPLQEMQTQLNESLIALLHPNSQRAPEFTYDPGMDSKLERRKYRMWDTLEHVNDSAISDNSDTAPCAALTLKEDKRVDDMLRRSHVRRPTKEARDPRQYSSGAGDVPEVDNCFDGSCNEGSAAGGSAADSSYRDSVAQINSERERRTSHVSSEVCHLSSLPEDSVSSEPRPGLPPPPPPPPPHDGAGSTAPYAQAGLLRSVVPSCFPRGPLLGLGALPRGVGAGALRAPARGSAAADALASAAAGGSSSSRAVPPAAPAEEAATRWRVELGEAPPGGERPPPPAARGLQEAPRGSGDLESSGGGPGELCRGPVRDAMPAAVYGNGTFTYNSDRRGNDPDDSPRGCLSNAQRGGGCTTN